MATAKQIESADGDRGNDTAMEYISQSINPLLEPMVTTMVIDRPEKPAQYMADWLYQQFNVIADCGSDKIEELTVENAALQRRLRTLDDDDEDEETEDEDKDDECDDEVGEMPEIPKMLQRPRHSVSAEAYGEWNKKKDFVPPITPKTSDQIERIQNVLKDSFLFSSLDHKDLNTVIQAMSEVELSEPTRIIHQGGDGDLLYVIESGEFNCLIKQPEGGELCVKTCVAGDFFGELALLYNTPRAASVESIADAKLWALDRETFNHIVKDAAARKRNLYESFLCNVTLLNGMDPYERSKVADALKAEVFKDGEYIVRQNEPGHKFYFIEEGEAIATKSMIAGQAPGEVMKYRQGDYFGELALLKNQPRAANVLAKGTTKVISLDRKSFKRLLGPLEAILERNTSRYNLQ